nr:MAG TPA: hypothetical protein [Bacteriophage sp.]
MIFYLTAQFVAIVCFLICSSILRFRNLHYSVLFIRKVWFQLLLQPTRRSNCFFRYPMLLFTFLSYTEFYLAVSCQ